jgi:hypothetical protein
MSKPIRFAREAREEVVEAGRWYERQRRGLRAEFLVSLDEAVERLARLSPYLTPIRGVEPALGVKRVYMQRFPFALVFMELPDRIRILAVAHNKRKPFYWRDRVNDQFGQGGRARRKMSPRSSLSMA